MLESQRTPISDECRLRYDSYMISRMSDARMCAIAKFLAKYMSGRGKVKKELYK